MRLPTSWAAQQLLLPAIGLVCVYVNLSVAVSVSSFTRYDDDNSLHQLRLEDLEAEHDPADLNRPPLLPTHYEWRPSSKSSIDAELERLRQLQLQHQQLSAGYALPSLPTLSAPSGYLLLQSASSLGAANGIAPTTPTTAATTTAAAALPLLKPIVPYELSGGVHYLERPHPAGLPPLPSLPPLPPPPPLPQRPPVQRPGAGVLLQSKQFAFAPPSLRNYAPSSRVPLPYPPSFVSITTRAPYAKPFRPSQPDPTPDLFAGRSPKSLLDSYIPSWEVLRLIQQHRPRESHQVSAFPSQRHTLAYPAAPGNRLYKRNSATANRIVKKSLKALV